MDGAPLHASETDAETDGPEERRLDRQAFGKLYQEAYPTLRIVAIAVAGPARADDIVQQAAIVAMERLDRYTPGTNFRAWMSAIVRGVARNDRRGERRRVKRLRAVADQGGTAAESPAQTHPDSGLRGDFAAELSENLRNALDQLGPEQRECFLLKTILGCSYQEISAITEIPEATARSHVHRARQRLMRMLDRGCDAGGGAHS